MQNLGDSTAETRQWYKYMVTIRKFQVKDKVMVDELNQVIRYIIRLYPSIKCRKTVYEVDPTYGQLHCHAIVCVNTRIKFASVSKYNNFRIYWRPIFDMKGAKSYLTKVVKSQKIQKQIINRNLLL